MMTKLRIFISSPGDVLQERKIAKNIIAELGHVYSQYVELETIMWEDLPLEATGSFQSGIDYFLEQAPIDIAVFILWSRLGSTLGQSYKKADGSLYASGTEYEFDTMYALWEKTKRPRIIVYVKDAEIHFGKGLNSTHIKEALAQQDKLNSFIEEKFRDKETGTNYAYLQFDRQQTFEDRLRSHLTRLILEHIGHDVQVKEWEGNPYVGLKSYDSSESPIFCGRKDIAYEIIEKVTDVHRTSEEPALMILGESGSGKSSLVKAGILPFFQDASTGERKYVPHIVTPSEFGGKVYDGLVDLLLSFYPGLEGHPVCADLKKGLDDTFKFEYLGYAIRNLNPEVHPILFLDQFEELFSDNSISEDDRIQSLKLLRGLVSTKAVWLIISMRNDFYSKLTTYPDFGILKNDAIVIDIPNISPTDIMEIVEEPARKAGLKWEINERGLSLSKQIIQDAAKIRDLPLIEFALTELYNKCGETGTLTFDAYNAIGKLHGSVVNYADVFFKNLSSEEQKEFIEMLPSLVAITNDKGIRFVRRTALKESLERNECCKDLISKLVTAHLLVSGKDINGNSTVSVVHEILISSWTVIKEWTKDQKQFLAQYDFYEKQARHWDANGRKRYELIQERSSLLEAEFFMFRNEERISPVTREFLRTSLLTDRRKGHAKYLTAFILSLIIVVAGIIMTMIGTTGDADMDETFGFQDIKWWDMAITYIPLVVALFHAVKLRRSPKFKYKTIAKTSKLWIGITGILIVSLMVDCIMPDRSIWMSLAFLVPLLLISTSVWLEHWRRKQWVKNRFVPYLTTDKFDKIKNIVIWVVASAFAVFMILIYGLLIAEKNEKLEKAADAAEDLFSTLNNAQERFNWGDNKYFNQQRMDFLETLYDDELSDTEPDEYEGKYALCLYNLYEPLNALAYLYPDHYWNQRYLYIVSCLRAGLYDEAEKYLESCASSGEYRDYNWISTANLIWAAEKVGRFDLAKELKEIVDQNNESMRNDLSYLINSGHILLMEGLTNDAFDSYDKAIQSYIDMSSDKAEARKFIIANLNNDMEIFRWLNVGDNSQMQKVYDRYALSKRDFHTSPADSTTTRELVTDVEGGWALADSSIVLHYYSKSPLCQYMLMSKDDDGDFEELSRGMTNVRCTKQDGHFYIEEFNPEASIDAISIGEIVEHDKETLSIKIIDNGDASDKGTVRIYHRIHSEE